MATGDPGAHGAHVTQQQAEKTDIDHAIIQQPKMEVPSALQGQLKHLQTV